MVKEYKEGAVFCAVCFKPLTDPGDIERGVHQHCKGRNGLTDDQVSSLFCKDDTTKTKTKN